MQQVRQKAPLPGGYLIKQYGEQRTIKENGQRNGDEVEKALLLRLQTLQQQQDGEAAFGEHVAACLRQMNPRERAIARLEIDKILFKVQYPEDIL